MKKQKNELESLFADTMLQPSDSFVKGLRKQLFTKPQSKIRKLWLGTATASALALVVIAASIIRPPVPRQAANMILVRDLYAKALAYEPQPTGNITYWDITQTMEFGPQADTCMGPDAARGEIKPTRTLFYKHDSTTAMYIMGGWPGAIPTMGYSEDPDVAAFDEDTLNGAENAEIKSLIGAQLTDERGNPLPSDAKVPQKTSGSYNIYSKMVFSPDNLKEYAPGCETLFTHIQIDAASGVFTRAEVFNKELGAQNLSLAYVQQVTTKSGSFEEILPLMQSEGFDLEKAKAETARISYVQVENKAAGYGFSYHKAYLGKPELTEVKNAEGKVTAYVYRFPKYPEIQFRIYTAAATNRQPKDVETLAARAKANGWNLQYDSNFEQVFYDKYGNESMRRFIADDGVRKYGMVATGSPDIPYVYVEAPVKLGVVKTVDPYITNPEVEIPDTDYVLSLLSLWVYPPGTEPPSGL